MDDPTGIETRRRFNSECNITVYTQDCAFIDFCNIVVFITRNE
jgi:hypothetical protein